MLVAILAIPISVEFSILQREEFHGQASLCWLFGLVRFRMRVPQAAKPTPVKKKPAKKYKSGEKSGGFRAVSAMLGQKRFRRRAWRFVRDCVHAIYTRDLNLYARVGLGDPADTGRLWAAVGPIAGMLESMRAATVCIEPDFLDATLEVDGHGEIHLIPLQLLFLATAFALSPSTMKALIAMRRAR